MAEKSGLERRRYSRYNSDLKLAFYVSFDFETTVDFRVKKEGDQKFSKARYSGTTKNINAEGLCFISNMELCKKDLLSLEVYLPNQAEPIAMEGRVRWSRLLERTGQGDKKVEIGVKLDVVKGEQVEKTIVFDEIHKIYWSNVLEIVFGANKDKLFEE